MAYIQRDFQPVDH